MATSNTDYQTLKDDVSSLRQDMQNLTKSLQKDGVGLVDRLNGSLGKWSDTAATLADDMQQRGKDVFTTVESAIEERPIAALLIAFIVGFLGSRLIERR